MGDENQNQEKTAQIVAKLSRLKTLLNDVGRMANEYWQTYRQTIDLNISETDWHQTIDVRCGDYVILFNTHSVYLALRTPYGEDYRVLVNGKGSVGDIISVPPECWDKLNAALEELIRKETNRIEEMRRLYYVYTSTA